MPTEFKAKQVEIEGVVYESAPEVRLESCRGCSLSDDAYIRDRISDTPVGCNNEAGIIWIEKEKTEVKSKMNSEVQTENTPEPKYTVSEVLDAVHYVEGSILWDYHTQIEQYLAKQSNPDYKLYLELKAKFGE